MQYVARCLYWCEMPAAHVGNPFVRQWRGVRGVFHHEGHGLPPFFIRDTFEIKPAGEVPLHFTLKFFRENLDSSRVYHIVKPPAPYETTGG